MVGDVNGDEEEEEVERDLRASEQVETLTWWDEVIEWMLLMNERSLIN